MSAEQLETGWHEFHTKKALTSIAYIQENGDVFLPDAEFTAEDFTTATCVHPLVRKPRTVTTVEELKELHMVVVRTDAGTIANIVSGRAYCFGYEQSAPLEALSLPATVLHEAVTA